MNAHDRLDGVLCHCDQTGGLPQDGHPIGTPGCESAIKLSGPAHPALCRRDHGSQVGACPCQGPAHGTCPVCGKRVRVVRLNAYVGPDDEVEFTTRVVKGERAMYGVARIGMVAHRHGGKDCPGEGQVPAETTYRESDALRQWRRSRRAGAA